MAGEGVGAVAGAEADGDEIVSNLDPKIVEVYSRSMILWPVLQLLSNA